METTHKVVGGVCVVYSDNDAFVDNAIEFRDYIERMIADQNIKAILVNLRDLIMLDSSGIGIIVNFHNQMQEQGRGFGLCELGKHVNGVFQLTRLDKVLSIYGTEEDALEKLNEP